MHLLGTLGAVIIFIMMMPSLLSWWDSGIRMQQQRHVADHLSKVTVATQEYINSHQAELLNGTTSSSGPNVTIQTLRNEGFLPANFSEINPWRQGYAIYIRQPANGTLQGIVLTTGGPNTNDRFKNVTAPGAAALVDSGGGYVGSGQLAGKGTSNLVGNADTYNVNLGTLGITSPGAGHIGTLTNYSSSALGTDQLYRISIPGMPELNRMQTNIDMNENNITNVNAMRFVPRNINAGGSDDFACSSADDLGRVFMDETYGLYICRTTGNQPHIEIIGDSGNSAMLRNATIAVNDETIEKPNCAVFTDTVPTIFTAPAISEAGAQAPPMTSVQTWATDHGNSWKVHMRVQTPDLTLGDSEGWVYPTANYGKIFVIVMCQKSG